MSEQQAVFSIEKIYMKDLSLELPNAPRVFMQQDAPEVSVQINTKGAPFEPNVYESVLTVTVTAKVKETTLFLVEVSEAGVFRIQNISEGDIEKLLAIACPNILFPYVREVVSDVVVRAGFPPVFLAPINFEALYQARKDKAAVQAS
ncbi:MAG: protein-export chaperone SecB [Burkholderiales bacterium]